MPLRKSNQRYFMRKLYAGELQTISLLKRGDDQMEGSGFTYTLYGCRRKSIYKSGQPIQREMAVDDRTTWQIPSEQLRLNGINYINVLDRIVDRYNRYWQPESRQSIAYRLFEDVVFVDCVRIDPPLPPPQGTLPASTGI